MEFLSVDRAPVLVVSGLVKLAPSGVPGQRHRQAPDASIGLHGSRQRRPQGLRVASYNSSVRGIVSRCWIVPGWTRSSNAARTLPIPVADGAKIPPACKNQAAWPTVWHAVQSGSLMSSLVRPTCASASVLRRSSTWMSCSSIVWSSRPTAIRSFGEIPAASLARSSSPMQLASGIAR